MIRSQINFFSKMLGSHVSAEVLIPNPADNDLLFMDLRDAYPKDRHFPVLYLLHGALEDESSWIRQTCIEHYAQQHSIAVVMPRGENSFYVNAEFGSRYLDFIADELPCMIEYLFPVCREPSGRMIAGCSMGGYGAARCALGKPGYYGYFGVFSGAVNPVELEGKMRALGFDFFRYDLVFGGTQKIPGSENDLFALAKAWPEGVRRPLAYICCSEDDQVNMNMNIELHRALDAAGFSSRYAGGKGGHSWEYWDNSVRSFLDAFCRQM